ncbi:MAG: serine/threonine-protein kinase [Myxococcota bacterium]
MSALSTPESIPDTTMLANMERFIAAMCEERAAVHPDSTTQRPEVASHRAEGDSDDLAAAPWHAIGSSLGLNTVALDPQERGPTTLIVPIGSRLGRYVVRGTLGRGGMGTVFEAHDESLERSVAVKLLHSGTTAREALRLRREALALAKLSHPNVVQVYEVGQADDRWFIAMELVQGQTLRRWQGERHDWRQSVRAYLQAGRGLAAAHTVGLVHRDFKPDNCIIDEHGRVRVLDFGLVHQHLDSAEPRPERSYAKSGESSDDTERAGASMVPITSVGTVMGTPGYMALEHLEGGQTDAHSDQFAFCVSLYEALYGERPYEGRSIPELITAMHEQQLRPVPRRLGVPAELHKMLQRGLATDPEARWPSMDDLLNELESLVAPRRVLRTVAWSVGVAAGLGLLGVGLAYQASTGQLCSGAQAQMEGIWDDARRQAIELAILGTERFHAADTWDRIGPQLDAYANAWIDTHTEVCEATSVHKEQPPETMDLRMHCLNQRRTALRAAVDVLADADTMVLNNAVAVVTNLPPLRSCNDLDRLQEQDLRVPPPKNLDVAAGVETQRRRLVEIHAMFRVGRYMEVLDQIETVTQQAEELGYPPLLAESLLLRGRILSKNGKYAKAEQDLRRAYTLAVEHHHESTALSAAKELTMVVGSHLGRHVESQQWGEMVVQPLAQRSGNSNEIASGLSALGNISYRQGEHEEAERYYRQALEILEKAPSPAQSLIANITDNLGIVLEEQGKYESAKRYYQRALSRRRLALGGNHPLTARSLNNMGTILDIQGDYEESMRYHHKALRVREQTLGLDHPEVAMSLNNLGVLLESKGEYEEAEQYHQRALAIREKTLGPDHRFVTSSLNNLGNVSFGLGNYEEAEQYHQRALEIRERVFGSEHSLTAHSLLGLGRVFDAREQYEEAKQYYRRALAIWEKTLGPNNHNVAICLINLGSVLHSQEEYEEAIHHYKRSLEILEKVLDPDNPYVANSLMGLANLMLDMDDPASARAYAERALSIREAAAVAPSLRAKARFVLARALWSDKSERRRARALVEQVQDTFAKHSPDHQQDLDMVKSWLATHRVK